LETKRTWSKKKPATEFEKNLGKRMRECRERLAISTEELANGIGLSPSAVTQYELGIRSPSLDRFDALAAMLGVSTDFLLRGSRSNVADADPAADQLVKAFKSLSPRDRALIVEILKSFLKVTPVMPSSDHTDKDL